MGDNGFRISGFFSAVEARSKLGEIVRRASGEKRERFPIGLKGGPQAVVLGLEDYLDLIAPENPLMAEIHAYSVAHGGDKIAMEEIDAEISASRAEERALDVDSICRP
jgi:hypothetical protein